MESESFGPVLNSDGSPSRTTRAFAREMGTIARIKRLKKGQVYCKLIIEVEVVTLKSITDDDLEAAIQKDLPVEMEGFGIAFNNAPLNKEAKLSTKNLKWRLE